MKQWLVHMVRITTGRLATRTGAMDHQRWQFQIVWEIKTRKLECRYIAASYCPIGLNVIRMIAFGRGNECDLCFKQAIRYGSGTMHLWLKGDDWRQQSTSSIKPGYNRIGGQGVKMYPLYRNLQQNVVYPHWMGKSQRHFIVIGLMLQWIMY